MVKVNAKGELRRGIQRSCMSVVLGTDVGGHRILVTHRALD